MGKEAREQGEGHFLCCWCVLVDPLFGLLHKLQACRAAKTEETTETKKGNTAICLPRSLFQG